MNLKCACSLAHVPRKTPIRCYRIFLFAFLAIFHFQEWFLERYHPKTEESKRSTKLKWIDQESVVFGKQLRANPRQFIASASLDPISEVNRYLFGMTCSG